MSEVLKRADVPAKYKWVLEDIIPGDDKWEELYNETVKMLDVCDKYKGKLNDEKSLLNCLEDESKVSWNIEKLYVYATMRKYEDGAVQKYQAMSNKAQSIAVNAGAKTSYIVPEITTIPREKLIEIANKPEFKPYSYRLKEIAREKEHILSEKEEKILSEMQNFSGDFDNIFSMFDDVDVKFEKIKDENGNLVEMSNGMFGVYMQNHDRKVREAAFNSLYTAYKNNINTLTAIYAGSVKKDVFFSKTRGYESSLAHALSGENINPVVYDNLIEAIHGGQKAVHDYVWLRREKLGYGDLHMYDMYVPIEEGAEISVPYEEAFKIVKEALKPLGEEYQGLLDEAYNNGWIDAFENKGKRTGAYSWGAYGSHPYVSLNYHETTGEIFTLAHELGHAMHTHYCSSAQPYPCYEYEIFVAEIASTLNECLMIKYLIKKTTDVKVKRYLLSYYLDMFRTTVFRQTMFSEFEKIAHNLAETDQPLTTEALSDAYYELNKQYYGDALIHDDDIRYEWARIPHFYRAFYVYKYATGLISAVAIANRILTEGDKAVADYKKFLSAGGSMSPLDTLLLAGVDLTKKTPFEVAMKEFADTLAELKSL